MLALKWRKVERRTFLRLFAADEDYYENVKNLNY
jgi:hypothetical protein